jgi:hypothetical protein
LYLRSGAQYHTSQDDITLKLVWNPLRHKKATCDILNVQTTVRHVVFGFAGDLYGRGISFSGSKIPRCRLGEEIVFISLGEQSRDVGIVVGGGNNNE